MERLEAQLRELRNIKPEKAWVVSTKTEILGPKEPLFGFSPLARRALVFAPIAIVLILGLHFYNRNVLYPQVASVDLASLRLASQDLEQIQIDLAKARENIETIEKPAQILALKEKVASTIEDAEKVVETSKQVAQESPRRAVQEVVTFSTFEMATENVEKATKDLEETYFEKQKAVALSEIEELEGKSLSERQQELLEEAKALYNTDCFEKALEKILEAQNY